MASGIMTRENRSKLGGKTMKINRIKVEKLAPHVLQAIVEASRTIDVCRAEQIRKLLCWKSGGCLARGCQQPNFDEITPQERDVLHSLWGEMPGSSSLMDAITLLCHVSASTTRAKESPIRLSLCVEEDSAVHLYLHDLFSLTGA